MLGRVVAIGRPVAAPQLRRVAQPSGRRPLAAQRRVVSAAYAAGGGAGSDPYEVLGIPSNADYNAIQRAYRKRMSENRERGGDNEAEQARIEAAHSQLMMSALTSRLQGNMSVEKDVLYADRARYFPWRPRVWLAPRDVLLYSALAQSVMLAWALLSPLTAGTQPVVWSAVVGAVAGVVKQNRINPPPQRGGELSDEEKKQGGKNILRGCFLAFLATFAGCFCIYTLPDAVAAQMGRVLPFWFYEGQTMLLAIGSCVTNWLFSALFR